MKARSITAALGLVLLAGWSFAGDDDRAVPRGGGGSGHSSGSSVGAGHHSGGSHQSSSGSSSSSGGSYVADPQSGRPLTDAQRRHPRAGTGTGRYHHGGGYYGYPYYGYPYYGYPYYGYGYGYGWPYYSYGWPYYGSAYFGLGWGYYGYSPYFMGVGYGAGGYAPYEYRSSSRTGSLRLIVEPTDARVYVDGYYAGEVDEFDGLFQRLNIAPGSHQLEIKQNGYRTRTYKVHVPRDQTLKIKAKLAKGSGSETEEVVGEPGMAASYEDPRMRYDEPRPRNEDRDATRERRRDAPEETLETGRVVLDVQPADASIYVDGEFRGTGKDVRSLRLPEGRHRIEVVRPGYRTFERDVDVTPGREVAVDVDLGRS